MIIEHIAVWTHDPDRLRSWYEKYFGATAGDKYHNPTTGLEAWFLSFASGTRLEIMRKPGVLENPENGGSIQRVGLIHLAFSVETMASVDKKARQFGEDGFTVLRGPRKTGDGYYEFEINDPDNNRIEVCTKWVDEKI